MFTIPLYLAAFPALLVLLITALVRANDIGRKRKHLIWQIRRAGFVLVAGASASIMLEPFWLWRNQWLYVVTAMMLVWGFALVWLTTPGLPPWWRYILGMFNIEDHDDVTGQIIHSTRNRER